MSKVLFECNNCGGTIFEIQFTTTAVWARCGLMDCPEFEWEVIGYA